MASCSRLPLRLTLATEQRQGGRALEQNGVSISQAVRKMFEYLEREQAVPDWMADAGCASDATEAKRAKLRTLAGAAAVNPADLREALKEPLGDLGDALLAWSAKRRDADLILTRNPPGFQGRSGCGHGSPAVLRDLPPRRLQVRSGGAVKGPS